MPVLGVAGTPWGRPAVSYPSGVAVGAGHGDGYVERAGMDLQGEAVAVADAARGGRDAGAAEARAHEEEFDRFFDRLPKEFIFERELLRSRIWRSPDRWELAH